MKCISLMIASLFSIMLCAMEKSTPNSLKTTYSGPNSFRTYAQQLEAITDDLESPSPRNKGRSFKPCIHLLERTIARMKDAESRSPKTP